MTTETYSLKDDLKTLLIDNARMYGLVDRLKHAEVSTIFVPTKDLPKAILQPCPKCNCSELEYILTPTWALSERLASAFDEAIISGVVCSKCEFWLMHRALRESVKIFINDVYNISSSENEALVRMYSYMIFGAVKVWNNYTPVKH